MRVEAFSVGLRASGYAANQAGARAKPTGASTDVGSFMCTVRRLWRL